MVTAASTGSARALAVRADLRVVRGGQVRAHWGPFPPEVMRHGYQAGAAKSRLRRFNPDGTPVPARWRRWRTRRVRAAPRAPAGAGARP